MNSLKILKKLSRASIFDVAKALHEYFPDSSTKRINDLILQLDSIDQAIDVLYMNKIDKTSTINELVFLILRYKDDKKR